MDVKPELSASHMEDDKKQGKNYIAYEKELILKILKQGQIRRRGGRGSRFWILSTAKIMYLWMLIMYCFSAKKGHIFILKLQKFLASGVGGGQTNGDIAHCTTLWEPPPPQMKPLPSEVLDPAL
ncbi:hypothetical protein PoB_001874000 [Plakobranchus ocellatus]|uniref:Uncharacterized protein n=1 Tax=Plakobranchus ocellatus TaxID=259542 RepID=A0AAV3ZAR9_9GAST|nr:hypothetical protein PoB_001874000 [Plakobranchus ocellatus]